MPMRAFLLLTVLAIAGCAQIPVLYVPPAVHAPMFDRSGQADLSFHAGSSLEARAAWSPVNHVAVAALGSWKPLVDSAAHAFHSYGELGIGVYTTLRPTLHGEAMAGVGTGKAVGYGRDFSLYGTAPAWKESGNYMRYFAQLTLGYNAEANDPDQFVKGFALAARVVNVRFPSIQRRDSLTSGSRWFLEPAVIIRLGPPSIQFEAQLGATIHEGGSGFEASDGFSTLGLHMALHELF